MRSQSDVFATDWCWILPRLSLLAVVLEGLRGSPGTMVGWATGKGSQVGNTAGSAKYHPVCHIRSDSCSEANMIKSVSCSRETLETGFANRGRS